MLRGKKAATSVRFVCRSHTDFCPVIYGMSYIGGEYVVQGMRLRLGP